MKECEYKKRLQLFLDGWMAGTALADIEEHLKSCPDCQAEMAELLDVNGAALEVIDQAPDRGYWETFVSRVRNRIIARDAEPVPSERKTPGPPTFSLTSVLIIVFLFIGATAAFLLRPAEKIEIVMPPAMSQHSSQGLMPPADYMHPPRIAGFGFYNYPPRKPVDTSNSGSGEILDNDKAAGVSQNRYTQIEMKNLDSEFRALSSTERTEFLPTNEYALAIPPSFNYDFNRSDPAFRLKEGFVSQRILAGLGMNGANAGVLAYQEPLSGYGSATGTVDGSSSNWGYLSNPSDTSRSSEISRYYIELELMQTK
jgi:hypothetical protein